ncbi:MAG: hypothetical protein WD557_13325 [Dehalococcoidia bacterium]
MPDAVGRLVGAHRETDGRRLTADGSRSIPADEGRTFAGMKVLRLGNSNDMVTSVPEELMQAGATYSEL